MFHGIRGVDDLAASAWALVLQCFEVAPATSYLLLQLATILLCLLLFLYALCMFVLLGTIPEELTISGSLVSIHPTSAFLFSLRTLALVAALAAPAELSLGLGDYVRLPLPQLRGDRVLSSLCCLALLHVATFALYALLPARVVRGYALNPATGKVEEYRLPGFRLLAVSVAAWGGAVHAGLLSPTAQWECRTEAALASCVLGLLCAAAFFRRGARRKWSLDARARCPTADTVGAGAPLPPPKKAETEEFFARSPVDHFYCGACGDARVHLGCPSPIYCAARLHPFFFTPSSLSPCSVQASVSSTRARSAWTGKCGYMQRARCSCSWACCLR